jgi:hypothetical protein
LFQEILEFKHTIAFCYGRQQSLAFQGYVPNPQIIDGILGLVVQQCVLNQNESYYLLSNALVITISLICQMQVDCLTLDSNETLDFDGELQVL